MLNTDREQTGNILASEARKEKGPLGSVSELWLEQDTHSVAMAQDLRCLA